MYDRELAKAIIRAANRYHMLESFDMPDVQLKYLWPRELVLKGMDELVKEGYLEQGVSLINSWPTEKGIAFLDE